MTGRPPTKLSTVSLYDCEHQEFELAKPKISRGSTLSYGKVVQAQMTVECVCYTHIPEVCTRIIWDIPIQINIWIFVRTKISQLGLTLIYFRILL